MTETPLEAFAGELTLRLQERNRFTDMPTMRAIVDDAIRSAPALEATANTCEDCMGDALALVAKIEAQERLIETLTDALKAAASSAGFQYMLSETRDQIDAAISRAEGKAS